MTTSGLAKISRRQVAHPVPKLVTLTSAAIMVVALVAHNAGASPVYAGTVTLARGSMIATTPLTNPGLSTFTDRLFEPWAAVTTSTTTTHAVHKHHPTSGTTTTTVRSTTTTTVRSTTTTTVRPSATSTTSTTSPSPTTTVAVPIVANGAYPVGVASSADPSNMAPPGADAFPGYSLTYVNDFNGSSLPSGWDTYDGVPGGDAGAQWSSAHVTVSGGLLNLNTYQDPAYNNEWVAGGLCQCGLARTYGAYFVRSRVTGAGPTNVELLWPTGNTWPPEIDFNETNGVSSGTSATTIWAVSGSNRSQVQVKMAIDMTQWHTWGVIWTPTSVTYTVDGRIWGTVNSTSEVPHQPMTLDLQQQTWCSSGFACPTAPQSMQIDWVAEYASN